MPWDVAVVGLGVNGAAAAFELAARGARVVAFDRFSPPHGMGSSHGRSRIIREAYFEHPLYVPLVRRAMTKWRRLEAGSGTRLLVRTGGVMVGPPDGVLVSGSLLSARTHDVRHELLDAGALRRRFPALRADAGHAALLEHDAGVLFPEECVTALLEGARSNGASLRMNERVMAWETGDGGVALRTTRETVHAASVIIAAGAWLPDLLEDEAPPLAVERQVFHWYSPARDASSYAADAMPIGLWEFEPGAVVATFPDFGDGVKIGVHHRGALATADSVDRATGAEDERGVRPLLERFLGDAAWSLRDAKVCMYTNTPDEHFIIDAHPSSGRVVLLSACSGHGFKFAPVTAELAADLALDGGTAHDIAPFRLNRLTVRPAQSA